MKKVVKKIFLISMPVLCLLVSGCSYFGVYSGAQVKELTSTFYERGIEDGRAHEIRVSEHARQEELARKQASEKFYRVPVPAHTTEDGVKVEAHYVPIRIVTE